METLREHDLLLLGSLSGHGRHDHVCELPPGSVLVLYTDGLVERRDSDIDARIEQAAVTVSRHGDRPLPLLLETLSRETQDTPHRDDVAILAVRVTD